MTPPPPEVVYPRVVQSLYKQWRQDTQSGKVLPPCILHVLQDGDYFASHSLQELSHPPVLKELFKDEGSLKRCLENQLDIERKVQCFQLSLFCVFCSSAWTHSLSVLYLTLFRLYIYTFAVIILSCFFIEFRGRSFDCSYNPQSDQGYQRKGTSQKMYRHVHIVYGYNIGGTERTAPVLERAAHCGYKEWHRRVPSHHWTYTRFIESCSINPICKRSLNSDLSGTFRGPKQFPFLALLPAEDWASLLVDQVHLYNLFPMKL